jgi:hypothetical protein
MLRLDVLHRKLEGHETFVFLDLLANVANVVLLACLRLLKLALGATVFYLVLVYKLFFWILPGSGTILYALSSLGDIFL